MISQAMRTRFPDGYWPSGMDGSSQYRSLEDFGRSIYPIWKGIEEKDRIAEEKLTLAEIYASGQVMFEIRTMHNQDLAIYNSGIKPMRTDENQEKMNRLRQKAVKASGQDYATGGR